MAQMIIPFYHPVFPLLMPTTFDGFVDPDINGPAQVQAACRDVHNVKSPWIESD
jgi:hypothetical protein